MGDGRPYISYDASLLFYRSYTVVRTILIFVFLGLFSQPALAGKAEERASVLEMRKETLTRLYKEEPHAREEIKKAFGYAVFSDLGVNVIFFSAGYGSGVAHNNKTGKDIFMEMATAGVGLGLGVKDYRAIFIFSNQKAYNQFVKHGWDFSGQADAAAKTGEKGGELSEALDVMPGVKLYQLTETGLALQATIQGTKYWQDDDLN